MNAEDKARWDRGVAIIQTMGPLGRATLAAVQSFLGDIAGTSSGDTSTWPSLNTGEDIEAIVFIVLMGASKSAQDDLQAIMAAVKAIEDAKKKQRAILAQMEEEAAAHAAQSGSQVIGGSDGKTYDGVVADVSIPPRWLVVPKYKLPPSYTKAQLDAVVEAAKRDLDSLSDLGEEESLRLQLAQDRLSKLYSTLSNLLKKLSDTASAIVQNLK
jgi:hypothetical protein